MALEVLVYDATDAARYAELIRAEHRRVIVRVASTPEEAATHIATAEVLYAWKPPAHLYAAAPRLRWLQAMGAGVDWALGPELPRRVVVTRSPGVFGPWMAEYVMA